MKPIAKIENANRQATTLSQPTVFEFIMNFQCEARSEMGLEPLLHWEKTRQTPKWAKNIYQNFRNTIFKSVLKLKPKGRVNWRNYGRCLGIMERYKTFLAKDMPNKWKAAGLANISAQKMEKLQPLLGEEQARQYCLKILARPASDTTSVDELFELILGRQLENFEKQKQTAFGFLADQSAKTVAVFLKGMSEGYTMFLDEEEEFGGDDRRVNIYLELLCWQHDIEKMKRSVIPKNSNHLIAELKKVEEFRNRPQDWFKQVFKDVKLSIGWRGRPPKFAQA
jgi:hypothetical protein